MGFRYFAEQAALRLGVSGWVRNRDDGDVEVYAVGDAAQLSELAGLLRKGPRWAEVRAVDESEAVLEHLHGFSVRP